jgi:cobalt-zinc-cadmium efflux system outer membrane protein
MKNITLIILLFSALSGYAQIIDDYLKIASENNPALKARYAEFEAAMQRIPQVTTIPDPTFSVSAFGQMIETRVGPQRAVFTLNQMFPWFGTLKAQGDAAALMAEARLQQWVDARNELFFQVKGAYYPLYELEQIIKFQEENKGILETFKTLATSQFKNGRGTMADVLRADIMLQDILTEINVLRKKRKPLVAQFNRLLNRELNAEVVIADSLAIGFPIPEVSGDSILENNPRLAELEITESAWEAQAVVAKKQGLPKLGVGLNYTVIGKRTDMELPDNGTDVIMPMVSISLPIYRKKYRASVKEAELMRTSVSERRQEVTNNLFAAFEMAQFEKQQAVEEYRLYDSQIQSSQQAITLLLSTYSSSGKDFEEVLRMQQTLLRYQITRASALKDYFIALARLDYLIGKKM